LFLIVFSKDVLPDDTEAPPGIVHPHTHARSAIATRPRQPFVHPYEVRYIFESRIIRKPLNRLQHQLFDRCFSHALSLPAR